MASGGVAMSLACGLSAAGQDSFTGKVTETMDGGGYTYVLVDSGTNKLWAAATKFEVRQGDVVAVANAMPMPNFHSKALNRDFPMIYFASSIAVNGANPSAENLPAGHPAIGGGASGSLPAGHPAPASRPAQAKLDFSGLQRVKEGKTVEEICTASTKLAGKSVKFRGKVVKYNANIMGRNWLHIQDGTGSAGSNDLLVTSTGVAKAGDTVLIEGKVGIDKDFGAGYKYKVLVEDAKVTVE